MPKAVWVNLILMLFWLALAACLYFGWLPNPRGGQFQSDVAALLALLMVAWNLLRLRILLGKPAPR